MIRREDRELLFMGKITGSITHDLNNVLATIEMNSALIQDICSMSQDTLFEQNDKIPRAFNIIDSQVNRGVELTNRLNSFAHIADKVETSVDLNEMVQQIVLLSERFARLKQVALKVVTHDEPLFLIQQPFRIQMILFFCLELILENLQSESVVEIRPRRSGRLELSVDFSPEDSSQEALLDIEALDRSPKKAALEKLVKHINGRIEMGRTLPWLRVFFR